MICHTISPYKLHPRAYTTYQQNKGRNRWKGLIGSPEHLNHIFERAKGECKFEQGFEVVYKRKPATVIHVIEELTAIEWDGFRARYIEIWVPDHEPEWLLVHHSEISLPRGKK